MSILELEIEIAKYFIYFHFNILSQSDMLGKNRRGKVL